MKFLVIGYGSIGKRHSKNIMALGHEVILLRRSGNKRNEDGLKEYHFFNDVVEQEKLLDGAIVSSPTSNHLEDVTHLISNQIPFLLEISLSAVMSHLKKSPIYRSLSLISRFKI